MSVKTTYQETKRMLSNTCTQFGKPIKPQFRICFQCYEQKRKNFQNRCHVCRKPISEKHNLCYQCHQLDKPQLLAPAYVPMGEM